MPSISDDFSIPIMYQDIGESMGSNPMPSFGYGAYPNLLGGVQMQPMLSNDQFASQNTRNKKSTNMMKTAALAVLALGSLIVFRKSKAFASISKTFTDCSDWVKNLFKAKPKP